MPHLSNLPHLSRSLARSTEDTRNRARPRPSSSCSKGNYSNRARWLSSRPSFDKVSDKVPDKVEASSTRTKDEDEHDGQAVISWSSTPGGCRRCAFWDRRLCTCRRW